MASEMDENLIQDFLTESAELIEQLDADLVRIEQAQGDELVELLNGAFRALHTIKGAASFLGLSAIITFAHAAEDALNRLRKGDVAITPVVMDAMLQSADVVRSMIQQLAQGHAITPGSASLIDQLHAIARQQGDTTQDSPADPSATPDGGDASDSTDGDALGATIDGARPLALSSDKADLLPFMAADMEESLQKFNHTLTLAADPHNRAEVAVELDAIAQDMLKTADFFTLDALRGLYAAVAQVAELLPETPDALMDELLIRLQAVAHLTELQTLALSRSLALEWPADTLIQRMTQLAAGISLEPALVGQHGQDVLKLLELDAVIRNDLELAAQADVSMALAAPVSDEVNDPSADEASLRMAQASAGVPVEMPSATSAPAVAPAVTPAAPAVQAPVSGRPAAMAEATIRVEVDRLEALLNLVGQLVLSKNRFLALSRKLRDQKLAPELLEDMTGAASDLDRLTSELQVGVMRTRMQPLAKLFDRYPRVIRDVARMTGKEIQLELEGRDTEVDKSVLELLADPLVHILRNSADHGVEPPQERLSAGKPALGTIRLCAEHQGSHVRVTVSDDGKGMDRQAIAAKAVEKGLVTADQVQAMSDEEVFRFIFAAGFSTAQAVTDLSGRGVGMDVVRANVAKMNGVVSVQSVKGKGSTIEILIPLTVAILPAMVVGVGKHLYAVPLASIVEIVRPESHALHSVAGRAVMTLRESVLPLINLHERLGEPSPGHDSRFAVVVAVGGQRAGLMVDRLIGQQEMVIKPLDDRFTSGGPFSGATIREDGDVSLILDVIQLVRQAQGAVSPDRTAA